MTDTIAAVPAASPPAMRAEDLVVGYDPQRPVLGIADGRGLDVEIPPGRFTAIIGPNACGKSTLLRSFARLLRPSAGRVLIGDQDLRGLSSRALARRVGLLPQSPITPDAITVGDLVARGRYAHQGILRQWSRGDEVAVREALTAAGVEELRGRRVDELSGGQRQRVWIALALAQQTDIVLLDEPTTFLDVAHQVEVLELATSLVAEGRTVVAVLHELALAARYSDHVIALRDGRIRAEGPPDMVITEEVLRDVFDLEARVIPDPDTGAPIVLPRSVIQR